MPFYVAIVPNLMQLRQFGHSAASRHEIFSLLRWDRGPEWVTENGEKDIGQLEKHLDRASPPKAPCMHGSEEALVDSSGHRPPKDVAEKG